MARWRGIACGWAVLVLGGAFLGALAALPTHAQVGPPTEWVLQQNDPDPYCPETDAATRFDFAAPQSAHVVLAVWSPDSTAVVRTLTDGVLQLGLFTVAWDGRDESAAIVPDGRYPYTLVATDVSTQVLLFSGSRAITVRCVTEVETPAWGAVKQLFR